MAFFDELFMEKIKPIENKEIITEPKTSLKDKYIAGRDVAIGVIKTPIIKKTLLYSGAGLLGATAFYGIGDIAGNGLKKLSEGVNKSLSNVGFNMPEIDKNTYKPIPIQTPKTNTKQTYQSLTPNTTIKPKNPITNSGFFSFTNLSTFVLLGFLGYASFKYIKGRK